MIVGQFHSQSQRIISCNTARPALLEIHQLACYQRVHLNITEQSKTQALQKIKFFTCWRLPAWSRGRILIHVPMDNSLYWPKNTSDACLLPALGNSDSMDILSKSGDQPGKNGGPAGPVLQNERLVHGVSALTHHAQPIQGGNAQRRGKVSIGAAPGG
jgi:hypothetical protein